MPSESALNALNSLYTNSSLAVAFVVRDDNVQWRIEWQNPAAESLWGHYDLNADLEFKLQLLAAVQRNNPTSFLHQLRDSVEPHQFTLAHYNEGLLIHFVMAVSHSNDAEIDSEHVYRAVVEAAGLGMLDWDIEADVMRYNDKLYQLCDVSPAELGHTKAGFMARIHPQDLIRFEDALFAHIEAHWPFNVAFRFKTSSENYVWMQATGQASWDVTSQKARRLVGSLRDISDTKRIEQTVRQREALIEQIIDALPISIYVKDAQGCFRFFSKQTEKQTGVMRNKAIGRTDFEVFSIEQARQHVAIDQEAKSLGQLIITEEELSTPNGTRWLMSGRGPIPMLRPDQPPEVWILGFSLDITERREMEEVLRVARREAEAAAKAKSEFLSVMSHEIRTPLNSVIGTSALLLDSPLNNEQLQHAEMIKRSGEHLLHLINDILDFNKLDAGQVELESHAFNLKEQLDTVGAIMKMNAELKQIGLRFDLAPNLVHYVWGDESRLRQILLNLIGNAVKFTEKGEVVVRVYPTINRVGYTRFEVVDTGIGIAEDKLNKLFTEFSQVDASTTRKYGGTGLGLSISKKLVEVMQGQIGVDSKFGEGSCFWFEIPTLAATAQDIQNANLNENFDSQRPLSILVAEDNPPNQLLIRAILTKLNHQVTIAVNGQKVLDFLTDTTQHYDLVLMDMQMPEMDGLEATRRIRQLSGDLANIPIVALTANALVGDRERVLEAGMNDYLSKPIDIHALKRALWQWSQ